MRRKRHIELSGVNSLILQTLRETTELTHHSVDVPAEVIADNYRHRWTVELFFRRSFDKSTQPHYRRQELSCLHVLSHLGQNMLQLLKFMFQSGK
jgi:hypothetical protein